MRGPGHPMIPSSILATVERDKKLHSLDHLVMVPGHAIWTGAHSERGLDEENWILEPYQKGGGRIAAFYNHIRRGVDITLRDEQALLIFSGYVFESSSTQSFIDNESSGQTKRASTTTEAESYLRLALSANLLPSTEQEPFLRATTEEYALDSFENLLFSIARFHEYTGHYPKRITIVGYEMKRKRFTELHRAALRWPQDKFEYIGIDAEGEEISKAREGERKNGYIPYTLDTYGCHDMLAEKRRSRNPFIRFHPYFTSSPDLAPLLNYCPNEVHGGPTTIYDGPLPWDRRH
ncbi:hypothetical protein EIP86_001315 [Pleurotus ostreatoroseus]|nr:hypothetical protein EIP86_001315 [Pleurotus ostreatoroseus]